MLVSLPPEKKKKSTSIFEEIEKYHWKPKATVL